jgi:predicted amidohydrolase
LNLRVALLQLSGNGCDQDANLTDGDVACRKAAEEGADVALFPELWNIAYTKSAMEAPEAELAALAVDEESAFVSHFRLLAKQLGMAIGLTYLERHEPQPRNAFALIDRTGEAVLRYAKVHTCDFSRERCFTPGDGFRVAELNAARGTVKVGAMICYDREFPESARVLMLQGAEVILTPNACYLDDYRVQQFKTRAYENMVGVAMANYAAPKENGRSCAFSGMSYDEHERPHDMTILEVGPEEGVYIAEFDIDALRAYRLSETSGDAFRKPYAYGPLVSQEVREPFVREDSRREHPGREVLEQNSA